MLYKWNHTTGNLWDCFFFSFLFPSRATRHAGIFVPELGAEPVSPTVEAQSLNNWRGPWDSLF